MLKVQPNILLAFGGLMSRAQYRMRKMCGMTLYKRFWPKRKRYYVPTKRLRSTLFINSVVASDDRLKVHAMSRRFKKLPTAI